MVTQWDSERHHYYQRLLSNHLIYYKQIKFKTQIAYKNEVYHASFLANVSFFSIFFPFWFHFQYVFSIHKLVQLPGTIKELQFLLTSWLEGTFPTVHLTKAPDSSSRNITVAITVVKADIISKCFSKSVKLSQQPKRISSTGKMVEN